MDKLYMRNIFLISYMDAELAWGDVSAVPNSAHCVVLGELPGTLWRASRALERSPVGLICSLLGTDFLLFFSGMLKPN